jgi:hypothetical protein
MTSAISNSRLIGDHVNTMVVNQKIFALVAASVKRLMRQKHIGRIYRDRSQKQFVTYEHFWNGIAVMNHMNKGL